MTRIASLKVEEGPRMQVKGANGEKLSSYGKCEQVSIKIQGNKFPMSFHLLTLGDCDMVLGVHWLKTLGPIVWDFLLMIMKFQ